MDCADYESMFLGSKGIKIFYSVNKAEAPKAAVVFVHGICEHLGRYNYIKDKFIENGYNVYRYDARGHGRSEGKRGYLESFDDYLDDLDIFVEMVRKENKDLKLILIGHSMGGLVATAYTSKYPEKVDLLAISGGANVCPKSAKALKFLPFNLIGKLNYANKLGNAVCSVSEVVEDYNKDELVLKKISFRLLGNAFVIGTNFVKKNIKNVGCPTLVMHGEKDGVVDKSIGEWTFKNLKCKDKKLKIYPNLYHEIFNEVNKDKVIQDLICWCDERMER
jgi:alpha-beta hydrolase superfamily lysophospholipase